MKRAKDLEDGQEIVISLNNPNNLTAITNTRGQLIYVSGQLSSMDVLEDPDFGVGSNSSLKLNREVEMYQWKETSSTRTVKTSGGGERRETTYSYDRVWSSTLINSDSFRQTNGHENPRNWAYEPLELVSDSITLGSFLLTNDVVAKFNWFTTVQDLDPSTVRDDINVTTYNYGYFVGSGSQNAPQIGDSQVEFEQVLPDTVSIVGLSRGGTENATIDEYPTKRQGTILLVRRGEFTAAELFLQAEAENEQLTWILRFVGWLAMFVGILLILQPFATFVDVIPFVGSCMEGGLTKCVFPLVAAIISIPTAAICIAIGWLAYRPIIAVPILVVSLGLIGWLCVRARRKHNESQPEKPPPPAATQPSYNQTYSAQHYGTTDTNAYSTSATSYGKPPQQGGEGEVYVPAGATGGQNVPVVTAEPVQPAGVYVPGAAAAPAPSPFSQALG